MIEHQGAAHPTTIAALAAAAKALPFDDTRDFDDP
ncbi:hypothetical protein PRI8871_03575 [Pseudoprimorskyibacter insulae]|uniref:Uncharacterized protein n=1 Tax=Pseudoprimorskyibacter insulae TaxID=1695997 RepID=A0A2R8B0G3_9RHOB|nr:hypothetical protein PRI8871_03575 [Pseudoprimorskyibacter insulae]